MEFTAGQSSPTPSLGWRKIWSTQIPPKLKNFIWRLCQDSLPTQQKLSSQGIPSPISCVFCGSDVEHHLHLFFDCQYAQDCWNHADLLFITDDIENFWTWLLDLFSNKSNEVCGRVEVVLWSIWT